MSKPAMNVFPIWNQWFLLVLSRSQCLTEPDGGRGGTGKKPNTHSQVSLLNHRMYIPKGKRRETMRNGERVRNRMSSERERISWWLDSGLTEVTKEIAH